MHSTVTQRDAGTSTNLYCECANIYIFITNIQALYVIWTHAHPPTPMLAVAEVVVLGGGIVGSGVTLIYVGKYQPAWELAPAAMAASTRRKTMVACLPARLSLSLSVFVFLLSLPAND